MCESDCNQDAWCIKEWRKKDENISVANEVMPRTATICCKRYIHSPSFSTRVCGKEKKEKLSRDRIALLGGMVVIMTLSVADTFSRVLAFGEGKGEEILSGFVGGERVIESFSSLTAA